jgi:hypothetical protein
LRACELVRIRGKTGARSSRVVVFVFGLAGLCLDVSCAVEHRSTRASPAGITLGWTFDRCRVAERDHDVDGVDDECELALATAFAPELVVDPRDCSWDVSIESTRLGGGYLFAAESAPEGRAIRIAYMPAYYRDCGWEGVRCVGRGPECAAHTGDSELIVVQVRYHPSARWAADAVFLSAHCFGRSDGRCRWYRGDELRHFAWVGGVLRSGPRIWVARGKHANYPSRRECDTGHWYYDSCDRNSVAYRFPIVSSAQNVGSRHQPLPPGDASNPAGCFTAERVPLRSTGIDAGTRECFWDPAAAFRGWQRRPTGHAPTPYALVLRRATRL